MHGELLHFHLPVIQTNHLTLRHILARLYGCTIFNVSLYVVCFFHFCDLVWSVLKFLGFSRFPCLVLFIWGQLIKYDNSRCHLPCKEMNSWNWHTHTHKIKTTFNALDFSPFIPVAFYRRSVHILQSFLGASSIYNWYTGKYTTHICPWGNS